MLTPAEAIFSDTYRAWRALAKIKKDVTDDMGARTMLADCGVLRYLDNAESALNMALAMWPYEERKPKKEADDD